MNTIIGGSAGKATLMNLKLIELLKYQEINYTMKTDGVFDGIKPFPPEFITNKKLKMSEDF